MGDTLRIAGRDLRAHRRGFFAWTLPVAGLLAMVVSIEPRMAKPGSLLDLKLKMLPDALKRVFGIGALDFTHPPAYLALNFVYVTLTAALSAGMLGATLVAKEEALQTAELLLTQPIARSRVLLGKVTALAVHVALFHLVLGAVALGGLAMVVTGPLEPAGVLSLFAGTAALGVCFGGVGMLIATLVTRARSAGNAALGIVLGAYLCDVVGAASPALDHLADVSPFHYVEPSRIVGDGLDPVALAALCAIGVAAGAIAFVRYGRRDILT